MVEFCPLEAEEIAQVEMVEEGEKLSLCSDFEEIHEVLSAYILEGVYD